MLSSTQNFEPYDQLEPIWQRFHIVRFSGLYFHVFELKKITIIALS